MAGFVYMFIIDKADMKLKMSYMFIIDKADMKLKMLCHDDSKI